MSQLFYGLHAAILLILPCINQQLVSWLSDRHTSQSVINMELGNPQLKGHYGPIHVSSLTIPIKLHA